MPVLSNFLRPSGRRGAGGSGGGVGGDGGEGYVCRAASATEVIPSLQWLLSGPNVFASRGVAGEFLRFAGSRGLDLSPMRVVLRGRRVMWAVLPVSSPGHTTLLSVPARLPAWPHVAAASRLIDVVCDEARATGVVLGQALLDPVCRDVARVLTASGFRTLAELVYLRREVSGVPASPAVRWPPGVMLRPYDAATHGLFAEAISASYVDSLDCPGLNGRRSIEDVIAGHRAAGEFDPSLWGVLAVGGVPSGCVLLNGVVGGDGLEVIYLGLAPAARGRGWGDLLVRTAIARASQRPGRRLTLACDAGNLPALRLYGRHGFREVYRRRAFVRPLTQAGVAGASASA